LEAHDIITTKLTWTREISRIVYAHCGSCHRTGGMAFSLMSYEEARPWAKAIQEEVLERRMPPWGAVKGFGDFRNDQALTQEQIELIAGWVEGGAPQGDPKDLPPQPEFSAAPSPKHIAGEVVISGDFMLRHPLRLSGLWPKTVPDKASLPITAELPGGSIEPLLWLLNYNARFSHPFLLRTALVLPSGTIIHGIPAGSSVALLPATAASAREHQTSRYSPHPSAGTAPKADKSAHAEKSN
jgi:hypothetical protein